jgi:uncharacterized protein YecT (DUF1311 family)
MTPGIRSGIKRAASYIMMALAVFNAHSANSQSFDCRKASTAVEKTVCTDTRLKLLDSEMAKNYQAAKKRMVPAGLKTLVATQRAWTAERDLQCATGDSDCIAAKYQERNDILLALLASTSDENPAIDLANPAVLLGTWLVPSESHSPLSTGELVPTAAHLPPPGARLVAKLGELCIVDPPQAKSCNPFGLTVQPNRSKAKHFKQNMAKGSVVLLTYYDGRADFQLIVGPNQELVATFLACEPTGKNCQRIQQPWRAASPDASIKVYHLFE